MYQAKESGKNTFRFYKKELSDVIQNHLNIEQALKTAIDNNEISLAYQPKYILATKKIISLEALVRWESKSLGFIPPDQFITIAEETGIIVPLGLYIFKQACYDFLTYQKIYPELKTIAINVSAIQFQDSQLIDKLINITKDLGIKTTSIVLEVTETHIMKDITQSMHILDRLHQAGFHISIDDFGTGHSSMSYLKQFPIDELKIDKSFIDDITSNQSDTDITKAIIALSKSMNYINIAEGIETKEQEELLLEMGCLMGQGYYFSKPKKREELIEFLISKLD